MPGPVVTDLHIGTRSYYLRRGGDIASRCSLKALLCQEHSVSQQRLRRAIDGASHSDSRWREQVHLRVGLWWT